MTDPKWSTTRPVTARIARALLLGMLSLGVCLIAGVDAQSPRTVTGIFLLIAAIDLLFTLERN